MKKATIYIDHLDDDTNFVFMQNWLEKWKNVARVAEYSTCGWEHIWDLEAPENALSEIPKDWHCSSKWASPEMLNK